MKAYKCDLCGKFHTDEQDTSEFTLTVDGVAYNDMCNSCLNWLQHSLRDKQELNRNVVEKLK